MKKQLLIGMVFFMSFSTFSSISSAEDSKPNKFGRFLKDLSKQLIVVDESPPSNTPSSINSIIRSPASTATNPTSCENSVDGFDDSCTIDEPAPPKITTLKLFSSCEQYKKDNEAFNISGYYLGSLCQFNKDFFSYTGELNDNVTNSEDIIAERAENRRRTFLKEIINSLDENNASLKDDSTPFMSIKYEVESGIELTLIVEKYTRDVPEAERIHVLRINREFCASDSTNSLDSGNKFRIQLDNKYGYPSITSISQGLEKALINQKKINDQFKKLDKMTNELTSFFITNRINDLKAIKKEKGSNYPFMLTYKNKNTGEIFDIEATKTDPNSIRALSSNSNKCSGNFLFSSSLSTTPDNAWTKRAVIARDNYKANRRTNAPTPSL